MRFERSDNRMMEMMCMFSMCMMMRAQKYNMLTSK